MFEITERIVIHPELSQNPSLGITAGGDMLVLHSDLVDVMAGMQNFLRRSRDGGRTWSEPELSLTSRLELGGLHGTLSCIGRLPGRPDEDLAFIVYGEGVNLKKEPRNPRTCRMMKSVDGGKNWSEPRLFEGPWGQTWHYGKIYRCGGSDELISPAYAHGVLFEKESLGPKGWMLHSTDAGESWEIKGAITSHPSVEGVLISETALAELPDGRLIAISRGDSIEPGAVSRGLRSVSEDGGVTWTPAEPVNMAVCEPRLAPLSDGRLLLTARSSPGNVSFYYRPLKPEEREPGSKQSETMGVRELDEYSSPVREFGVGLFMSEDDGRTWSPVLNMESPRGEEREKPETLMKRFQYQAGYGDILPLGDDRFLVAFRQGDPGMPDMRPGLTYSHCFQRFLAGNIISPVG